MRKSPFQPIVKASFSFVLLLHDNILHLQEEITVIGASRTDSGVHALGNVAVFDTNTKIPADKISFALNQHLPCDIRFM